MKPSPKAPPANAQPHTALILSLFRVNNLLVAWGDRLVADLGLTSARWQLLGTIAFSDRPQPVAWLARDLGASRQNIQRIVNDLVREDLVSLEANPHHKRAHLVVMTSKGTRAYEQAVQRYAARIDALFEGISSNQSQVSINTLMKLRAHLEDHAQE